MTLTSSTSVGYLIFDVNRHRVYPDQPLSEAIRHYMSVRSLSFIGKIWLRKLEAATKDIEKAQTDFLLGQLKENADTEYSREYKVENFMKYFT